MKYFISFLSILLLSLCSQTASAYFCEDVDDNGCIYFTVFWPDGSITQIGAGCKADYIRDEGCDYWIDSYPEQDLGGEGSWTGILSDTHNSGWTLSLSGVNTTVGAAVTYVAMQTSTTTLRTRNFPCGGTGMTLNYNRMLDFNYFDSPDSTTVNRVSPDASKFGSTSLVRLITRLRRASDNAVLMVLDTCTITVNGSGRFQYRTMNDRDNKISTDLSAISVTNGYIEVTEERFLPGGSTVTSVVEDSIRYTPVSAFYGRAQVFTGALKEAGTTAHFLPSLEQELSNMTLSLRPSSIVAKVTATSDGQAECVLFDVLGREIASYLTNLSAGSNTISLSRNNIPAGTYFYSIRAGGKSLTSRVVL